MQTHTEINPLNSLDKETMGQWNGKWIDWATPGLYIFRFRLISDPGFPFWDVSYCYGTLDGEVYRVQLPFDQLPKFGARKALYHHARKSGTFIRGLFANLSFLQ